MIRYLFLSSLLALTACQSNQLVELDYRPDYPYQSLRTWQWSDPAVQFAPNSAEQKSDLDAQRLREAISQQLTQQGLQHSNNGQILVRAWLISEIQPQRTEVLQYDYWGGIWGPALRAETYDSTYTVQKLQIDLLSADTQQLIWRGSNSWPLPKQRISPSVRETRLREQVQHILQRFPPY